MPCCIPHKIRISTLQGCIKPTYGPIVSFHAAYVLRYRNVPPSFLRSVEVCQTWNIRSTFFSRSYSKTHQQDQKFYGHLNSRWCDVQLRRKSFYCSSRRFGACRRVPMLNYWSKKSPSERMTTLDQCHSSCLTIHNRVNLHSISRKNVRVIVDLPVGKVQFLMTDSGPRNAADHLWSKR